MPKNFAQSKGARGERLVIQMLQPIVDRVYFAHGVEPALIPVIQRNTLQSHLGGCDLCGLEWLAIEVKSQETLNLNAWTKQCIEQAKPNQTPVLLYKQNNKGWKVMMHVLLVPGGSTNLKVWAGIDIESFLQYFEYRLTWELNK